MILFGFSLSVLAGLIWVVVSYRKRVERQVQDYSREWLISWLVRGVAVPVVVWLLLNAGTVPVLPALVRTHPAMASGFIGRFLAMVRYALVQTSPAMLAIGSYWAALTLGYFSVSLIKRSKNREDMLIASLLWSPLGLPFIWLLLHVFGWSALGFAAMFWLWPLTHYVLLEARVRKHSPSYAQAIGKMKFGKYGEAELSIIKELEESENDFDGWLMLAELYATKFNNLGEAQQTIYELCGEPTTSVSQISVALHRLADWQLKYRNDPVSARRALEEICTRMPGTHLANMARMRISQLPANEDELHEQQKGKTYHMPALADSLNEPAPEPERELTPEESLLLANQFVEKLKKDPNDVLAREKLARVFAERLGQVDLGLHQINLLLDLPGQPPEKMAEWLGMLAAWQLKYRADEEAARRLLERLISEFPQSSQAFAAQRRLSLLDMERKARRLAASPKPKLSVYDPPHPGK